MEEKIIFRVFAVKKYARTFEDFDFDQLIMCIVKSYHS